MLYSTNILQEFLGNTQTIVVREGDREIPCIFFGAPAKGFPFAVGALVQNFVSLLNGNTVTPITHTAVGTLLYEVQPQGVLIRYQDGQGISHEGLQITINSSGIPSLILEDIQRKLDGVFMKSLCDAVQVHVPGTVPTTRSDMRH
jgi:hypothetical protein